MADGLATGPFRELALAERDRDGAHHAGGDLAAWCIKARRFLNMPTTVGSPVIGLSPDEAALVAATGGRAFYQSPYMN